MEKMYFYMLDQSLWCDESHYSHWLNALRESSPERKWERRDLRRKCQSTNFLIGLFLAAGDSNSLITCWSSEGGFLQNGNILRRTVSLAISEPVGNCYPMTSSSKLDRISIYSLIRFYFWQLPYHDLISQKQDPSDSQKPEEPLTNLTQNCLP